MQQSEKKKQQYVLTQSHTAQCACTRPTAITGQALQARQLLFELVRLQGSLVQGLR